MLPKVFVAYGNQKKDKNGVDRDEIDKMDQGDDENFMLQARITKYHQK